MPLVPRKPLKIRTTAFPVDSFRRLIFEEGARVLWEQNAPCPCTTNDGDWGLSASLVPAPSLVASQRRADCPVCFGAGRIYHSAQEIPAIFTRGEATPRPYSDQGDLVEGWASFSMLPEHLPAWGDRLSLLDGSLRYDELLVRSGEDTQALRYSVKIRTLDLAGGPTELGTLYVRGAGADGLPGPELALGVDYLITDDGEIDLRPGDALGTSPAVGRLLSVSFYAAPTYVVTSHPHSLRDRWDAQKKAVPVHLAEPVQVRARLEYLGGADE